MLTRVDTDYKVLTALHGPPEKACNFFGAFSICVDCVDSVAASKKTGNLFEIHLRLCVDVC